MSAAENLPEHELFDGLTAGARLATDQLFNRGSQLVVDASHVQTVEHHGLSVIPIDEVFTDPTAAFIGFGFPNVFLAVPRLATDDKGVGWDRFAAFMFWRQSSYVHDTRGRVQGGVIFELRGLSPAAIDNLRLTMANHEGQRNISCAHANARVLNDAGFTCGGERLSRSIRPMRLARRIWENGLEYAGQPIGLRVIRTNGGSVSDHFAGVIRKEATSFGRAIKKMWKKRTDRRSLAAKASAPIIAARPLEPVQVTVSESTPRLELRVGKPSRVALLLRLHWGEHPIFEAVLNRAQVDLDGGAFPALAEPLVPFPGTLDAVTKAKKYVLFSRPSVKLIRRQMAKDMESLGRLAGPTLVSMLQADTPETPFIYNVVLTGSSFRLSRLENRSDKDVDKANWILAKHVLLSGYDPDVRYAGEAWAEDTPDGRIMHINNNSGTYKPSPVQLEAARRYLSEAFEMTVIAHAV